VEEAQGVAKLVEQLKEEREQVCVTHCLIVYKLILRSRRLRNYLIFRYLRIKDNGGNQPNLEIFRGNKLSRFWPKVPSLKVESFTLENSQNFHENFLTGVTKTLLSNLKAKDTSAH